MLRRSRTTPIWLLSCSLLGCTGHASAPEPAPVADPCILDLGAAAPHQRVALLHPVDAQRAPAAGNASERLLFRQLYQTLVTVDCAGAALPELAESWSMLEHGRVWEFRLRANQSLRDGTSITPHTVMRSWAERSLPINTMNAVGAGVLRIELSAPVPDVRSFADPAFAIALPGERDQWPLGSGAFGIDSAGPPGTIRLTSGKRIIDFVRMNSVDARAALDAGLSVVQTHDPAALAYAQAIPAYAAVPMPWSRTYVLAASGAHVADSTSAADELYALTRDAVRAAARAAQPPFWWQNSHCHLDSATPGSRFTQRAVIAYPAGDAIAQAIAERIAAVAWPLSRAPAWLRALLPPDYAQRGAPAAVALDEGALMQWQRTQRALAYVLPLPRVPSADCNAWLMHSGHRITPILDVRDHLIHRDGIGRVQLLGDGTVRFHGGQP